MKSAKESCVYTLKGVYLPFSRVEFVTETEIKKSFDTHSVSRSDEAVENLVDGTEISNFYNQVTAQSFENAVSETRSIKNTRAIPKNKIHSPCEKVKVSSKNVSTNSYKAELLHRYAQDGNLTGITLCVENDVNLNVRDSYGWTPLMCAVCSGHVNIVKYLLQHNADPQIRTLQGITALDIAKRRNGCSEILELLQNPSKTKIIKQEPVEASIVVDTKFCYVCRNDYTDLPENHERSIAHMLNCSSKKDKTFYHIPENNKGYQIMLKKGWDGSKGLGPNCEGRKYPIKTVFKQDRSCIGRNRKEKQRITHFGPNDTSAVESNVNQINKPVIMREKILKKRERENIERKKRRKEIAFRREFYMD